MKLKMLLSLSLMIVSFSSFAKDPTAVEITDLLSSREVSPCLAQLYELAELGDISVTGVKYSLNYSLMASATIHYAILDGDRSKSAVRGGAQIEIKQLFPLEKYGVAKSECAFSKQIFY